MDELRGVSSVPTVRSVGPSSRLKTLGDAQPTAANDAGAKDASASAKDDAPARRATLKITPSSGGGALELPTARQGRPYERQTLSVSGGAAPYRFRIRPPVSDLLSERAAPPPGLKLSDDGVIAGEPKRGGVYRFTVEARDANGEIGLAEYIIAVRLDLSRYKCAFDPVSADNKTRRKRPVSHFDPDELDVDGQAVYPLSLTEFLAYKSAQAYLKDDPLDPAHSLQRELALAHPKGELNHFAFFDSTRPLRRYSAATVSGHVARPLNQAPDHWSDLSAVKVEQLNEWRAGLDAQAFGFVFEGRAYVICRGSTGVRDWRADVENGLTTDEPHQNSWWENVKFRVGLRGLKIKMSETERDLIGGPDPERYLRPARAIGFAAAWAAIRDQVENWLAGLPKDNRREFVFSGHGLGGAMALIGAQEFSEKHDRKIHAVVTFGAPCVGRSADSTAFEAKDHFADNYGRLQNGALARRTLRVEAAGDAMPKLLQPKKFAPVGRLWELEFEPLPTPFTLFTRRYVSGPLLCLARGGLGYDIKGLDALPRKALGYTALYGVPVLSKALGAHGALKRYAAYFSALTYRRIREARLGDLDSEEALATLRAAGDLDRDGDGADDRYFLVNTLFDQHLRRVYAPKSRRRFTPRFVCGGSEEARLAKRYYGDQTATHIF